MQDTDRIRDRRIAALLFVLALAVYSFTLRGYLSFDEETMFCVTESLWERSEVCIRDSLLEATNSYVGRDGLRYSWYDLGQSLLALPLYGCGRVAAMFLDPASTPFVTRFAVNHMGALFGALSVALFYLCARRLGASARRAMLLALIVAFATPLWFYSRTFYREAVNAFLFLAIVRALLDCRASAPRALPWLPWVAAGAATGMAILLRFTNVVVCLPMAIYIAQVHWPLGGRWRELRAPAAWCAAPIVAAIGLSCFYSYWRFGAWLPASPVDSEGFSSPLLVGLWGELFSPGRGLLLFAPLLFALPMFAAAFLRRRSRQAEGVLLIGVAASVALVFAKWVDWHGGSCWGPRYLVPIVPLLFLFFVRPLRPELAPAWNAHARRLAFAGVALFSCTIQANGIVLEGRNLQAHAGAVAFHEIIYNPRHSSAVHVGSWAGLGELSFARAPAGVAPTVGGSDGAGVRELLETSPGCWWALLYRMNLPAMFLLPAVLEALLGMTAGALLARERRGSIEIHAPASSAPNAAPVGSTFPAAAHHSVELVDSK